MSEPTRDYSKVEYPSNSRTQKPAEEMKKVAEGKVSLQKRKAGKKLADIVFWSDIGTIIDHIIYDMIIPKAKDVFINAIAYALTGQGYRGSGAPAARGEQQATNYTSFSDNKKPSSPTVRTLGSDILFSKYEDADKIRKEIISRCQQGRPVSVRTLYGLAGLDCDYTKAAYGWRDVYDLKINQTEYGYSLDLPRPIYLGRDGD